MSLYAVKNDEGKWLGCEIYCDESDWFDRGGFMWDTRSVAEENVNLYGGHVVELVEAPAKVVVSEDEAEMLKNAKDTTVWRPASVIAGYAYEHEQQGDDEVLLEDRLMRAYVNGYTVAKEKKYLLPMDGTLEENDGYNNYQIYAYCYKGRWLTDECETDPAYPHFTVTQKELETAPAWVKAIKPVEVIHYDD